MKNNFKYILFAFLFGCSTSNNHYIGEKYLGAKYVQSPLGEEKAPDTDPLIRFDAFDCITFVETSLADGDLQKLIKIRYKDGKIDFLNRNHFTETDWLWNNKDIFENVSALYGKTSVRKVVIDKQNWFKKVHNIDVKTPKQHTSIEYIAYSDLTEIKTDEPLIVLFIYGNPKKYDKIGTDLAVIHVGFLLPNGNLRHASRYNGRVMDTDFMEYATSRAKNKHNLGIALVKIK